jgi:glutamate-ammonia-ligase adenylyltransferase
MEIGYQHLQRITDAASAAGIELADVQYWPHDAQFVMNASSFIADSFAANPALLEELLRSPELRDGDADEHAVRTRVVTALDGVQNKDELTLRIRRIRRREMVRIAWRDLGGGADLTQTLRDLSAFADAAIHEALKHLDKFQRARRGIAVDEDGVEQQLVVFALGKLGAEELNFSSDVDLIFAYPSNGETTGHRVSISNHEYFLELSRALIDVLQRPTADGFVFRVDMRLRPFGGGGPLTMSFDALLEYYQNHGRDWERYALIRMRPIAGDVQRGNELTEQLHPFIYRRYLDFGSLESLREMKAMIAAEVTRRDMGDHIKLGPGGIREIEFTVQAFQLVRAGRAPEFRERHLSLVLERLANRKLLPDYAASQLRAAYVYLRRVENRLQEFNDQQTHTLPKDEEGRTRLARSMHCANWEELSHALSEHRENVRAQFDQVLGGEAADHEVDPAASLLLSSDDDHLLESILIEFGFAGDSQHAREHLTRLRDSVGFRAMDETGERRLKRLLPDLLRAVAATELPLLTLERVLLVIAKVLRRSTYLALLHERLITVPHLVRLCGASPWITAQLAAQPHLLDELLDARTLYRPPERNELQIDLDEELGAVEEGDVEQEMAALRQFRQRQMLRVAAADLAGAVPLMIVSDHLSNIAEVCLMAALRLARRDISARHGVPRDEQGREVGFAIVAYGKLGGIELAYGSDLDVVFVHGECKGETDGKRAIDAQVFFLRLAQRIVHYIATTTAEGFVYRVDTRLRPHGKDGMLACSLDSFAHYLQHEAWTWEYQALVRARGVAGDPQLSQMFAELRENMLLRDRKVPELRQEVREMRRRMQSQLGSKDAARFNIKQDHGGITDIEFIVQFATLRWAKLLGNRLRFTDNIRLLEALQAAQVIDGDDASTLEKVYKAYRERSHQLSLQDDDSSVAGENFIELRAQVAEIWSRIIEEN